MKKVALYIRTSKRDMNPENQLLQLERYAQQREWAYEVFCEQESTRHTRPVKQNLLNDIRNGRFDGVLVWKLDRWARSLQELIMDVSDITGRGREFIVLTAPIDTTNASGRLFLQVLGAFAEFEREIIRERTLAGIDRARAKGKKLGRPRKKVKIINHYIYEPAPEPVPGLEPPKEVEKSADSNPPSQIVGEGNK